MQIYIYIYAYIYANESNLNLFIFYNNFFLLVLPLMSNKVAIVTGGSRGIGAEVVKKLLRCDMEVIIGKLFIYIRHLSMSHRNVLIYGNAISLQEYCRG